MRAELFNALVVESYLTTLAFAESPERYQMSGPFDGSRFHFTKATRARAAQSCRTFLELLDGARCGRFDDVNPMEMGQILAYARNGHGVSAGDVAPQVEGERGEFLDKQAACMGHVYPKFRKRRGKIELSFV